MKKKLTEAAQTLGKKGGDKTKARGSLYYREIGLRGLKKRWGNKKES